MGKHGVWMGEIPQKFFDIVALFGVWRPSRSGLYIIPGYCSFQALLRPSFGVLLVVLLSHELVSHFVSSLA